jgi:ribosomal protein L37E
MVTAKVYCKVGTSKPKSVKSKILDGTPVQIIQEVNKVRTVIASGTVTITGPIPPEPTPIPPTPIPPTPVPIPPTGDLDKFGVRKLYQSIGREWFNNWDNGHARSWKPASTNWSKTRNADPDDNLSNLHCKPEERGILTEAIVDGKGVCTLVGTTPRLYVNDPAKKLTWLNVEMTVYFFIVKKLPAGGAYVACRLCGRSNHNLIEQECSAAGTGYAYETKNSDGTNQLRRENGHPAYSENVKSSTKGVEAGKWIGAKLIVKNVEGGVLVQGYRDLTNGLNGGDWKLMVEKLDKGDWKMEDLAEYADVNSCSGFPKVPYDKPILDAATSCYLRVDNNEVRFKYFSIREI